MNNNPGFDVEHLIFADISLPDNSTTNDPGRYGSVYQALRSGVETVLMRCRGEHRIFRWSKHRAGETRWWCPAVHTVRRRATGWDSTMWLPGISVRWESQILHGQDFDGRHYGDGLYGLNNIVVNESFAKHFWPGRDAIGQQVLLKGRYPATVIGVVGDTRDKSLLVPGELRYFIAQPSSTFTLVIRTADRPDLVAPIVRERIASLGLGINRPSVILGADIRGQSLRAARIVSASLTALTSLALGLAALGLYGLVAFAMERRTREIGLRLALGARSSDIYSLASSITLRPAMFGLAFGSLLAVGLARIAISMVEGVGGLDVPILIGTVIVLGAVVAVSAFLPARRAMRVEPSVALRDS